MPKCLFCDNTKLTKEHVWPTWIVREFKKHMGRTAKIAGTQTHNRRVVHKWPTTSITYKRPLVCEPCNSRWMSELETFTKPILAPLIHHATTLQKELTVEDQCTLAAWATLRTMIFDSLNYDGESGQYFLPSERAAFATSPILAPPLNIHIWLVRFLGRPAYLARFFVRNNISIAKNEGSHISTWLLNQIGFQVLVWKGREQRVDYDLLTRDGWDNVTRPVWPFTQRSVFWPPPQNLNNESFQTLADRFGK
jgi:hypothetical protein